MYKFVAIQYGGSTGDKMNDVLRSIAARRSIRQFKAEQIKREDLDAIVEAGVWAPSANNVQDWHFTIVQDGAMLAKINRWVLEEIESSGNDSLRELVRKGGGSIFRNAPTVIIVSSDARNQNGIAAQSLGISSCWIGMVSMLSGSRLVNTHARELQLPEGYSPHTGITLGYKDTASPPAPARRKNLVSYFL